MTMRLIFRSPQWLSELFVVPVDHTGWAPRVFCKTTNGWTPDRARASFQTATKSLVPIDRVGGSLSTTFGLYIIAASEPYPAIYVGIAAGSGEAPEGILSRIRKHRVKLTGSHVGASPHATGGVHHPSEWRDFAVARHGHFTTNGNVDDCSDVRLVVATLVSDASGVADEKALLEAIESAIVADRRGILGRLYSLLWESDAPVRLLTSGVTSRELPGPIDIELWNGAHVVLP